jgi:hypothetical protein
METSPMTPPDDSPPTEARDSSAPSTDPTPVVPRPGRLWALALGAAVAAGLVSTLVGESIHLGFKPPRHVVQTMGGPADIPEYKDDVAARYKNAVAASAVLGASLGLALGLAGGLARGSFRAAVGPGLIGVVAGGLVGGGAALGLLPIYFHQENIAPEELSRDLVVPFLMHAGIWAAIGAASGAAFGLGLGSWRLAVTAAVGGLVGGLLGAVLYEVVGALALPNGKTSDPVAPILAGRLLARFAVSMLVAALAVLAVLQDRRRDGRAAIASRD